MRPGTVVLFYWWRLRTQPLQELLAAVGIAAGVALVFAVQVANTSIGDSVEQAVHSVSGKFKLQVAAHDARGFSAALTRQVARIDGVQLAAPVLEQRVGISGSKGETNVSLLGVTPAIANAGGSLVNAFGGRFGPRLADALLIPRPLAASVGAGRGGFVRVATRKPVEQRAPVSGVLDEAQIGAAVDSPIVIAPLGYVQRLSGLEGRVTRVLVAVRAGRETEVRRSLTMLVGDRLAVEESDSEVGYVKQAATPNNQSTGLFAGICAIVGILFTFNAMLLTVPERRRVVAELRMEGYRRRQVLTQVAFETAVLGVVASAAGLLLGDVLSRHVFHTTPGYLSFAFTVGSQRIVQLGDIALALAGGVGATFVATTPLLRDAVRRGPVDALTRGGEDPGEAIGPKVRGVLAVAGIAALVATTALALLAPSLTMVCIALLAVAMLTLVPALLAGTLTAVDHMIDGFRGSALPVAVMELRSSLTRATALAATGALALFGTVAIQGAHRDLLHGLDVTAAAMLDTTDVWVTAAGDENILMTTPFAQPDLSALRRSDGVADVRSYRGEFLDMSRRRVWIMARPPEDRPLISPTDIQEGNLETATRRLREGDAAALSASVADQLHIAVGDRFAIPTPSGPRSLRVAAIVSNLGWAPGTLVLSGETYDRWWPGTDITALEVDGRPGVSPSAVKAAVERALPASSPLLVETSAERKARFGRLERQGLNRLSQISWLLLGAAVLAMGAAMAGTVWWQRRRLASLRMQGYSVGRVMRLLLMQACLVLAVGSLIGAAFGLYGQALGSRWLELTTGFPTIFSLAIPIAGGALAIVGVLALAIVSIPGYFAARTTPTLAFRAD